MLIHQRSRAGFTLIELMITCGLIGLLAAIAIPNFLSYQARTRRSEAFSNLAGIARAYKTYHAEKGRFPHMAAISLPAGPPTPIKMTWDPATQAFFDTVGWRPDGNVYHSYEVASDCGSGCTEETCFTLVAHGDVDGRNGMSAAMYVHPTDAAGTAISCPSFLGYSVPVRGGTEVYDEPVSYLGAGADLY